MKKLSNTDAELKKTVAFKKNLYKENKIRLQKPINFVF